MTKQRARLSGRIDTALAKAGLQPAPKRGVRAARLSRQCRFRDYVRKKRRR